MTRAEMHEKHTAEWSQLILEVRQSNLTIKGWCKEKGISEKTFYFWRRCQKSQNPPSRQSRLYLPPTTRLRFLQNWI